MKWRMETILLIFLLMLGLSGRGLKVYGSNEKPLREAKSGDVEEVNGEGDVDVAGEIGKTPSANSTSITPSATAQIGGKVIDTTGKGIRTGDVALSVRGLAVVLFGAGILFLLISKKKQQESA